MSRRIILNGKDSVSDIGELNRLTEALVVVDEVYRVMLRPDVVSAICAVDFRKREYRQIPGAQLEGFRLKSPPEIIIYVDDKWLAALAYVLVHYKSTKENVNEMASDASEFICAVQGLTRQEAQKIVIGIKLFRESLLALSDKEQTRFVRRVKTAAAKLRMQSMSVEVSNEEDL